MNNKVCFIAVLNEGQSGNNFKDLRYDNRTVVINSPLKPINNKFIRLLRKIHISPQIFNKINLPFKDFWTISFDKFVFEKDTQYFLFFTSGSVYPIHPKKLIKLRKEHSVKLILYLLDAWSNKASNIAKYYMHNVEFDYIFTIDNNDAKQHKFIFSDMGYSMDKSQTMIKEPIHDLYFVGFNKGRLSILLDIIKCAFEHSVDFHFRIPDIGKENIHKYKKFISSEQVAYSDSLKEMANYNCILEILTEGQSGATLRYYEAVCYNKKLLTNNLNVCNLPFYNPDYMHTFISADDIDFEWVTEKVKIDYRYNGRFSPVNLIDKVLDMENKKAAKKQENKNENS